MNTIDRFLRNKYDIENWKKLIKYLQNNKPLMEHAKSRPSSSFRTFEEIRYYLGKAPTEILLEKAWVIYVWLCLNERYIETFKELCDYMGITCYEINGYAKGDQYKPNSSQYEDLKKELENHTWYAIELGFEKSKSLYLIDCKWGAKIHTNRVNKDYQPYYFLQPPQIFIYEHYSSDYQLQGKKISFEKFLKLPRLRYSYFVRNLECTTHDLKNEINMNMSKLSELRFEFTCGENMRHGRRDDDDDEPIVILSGTMHDTKERLVPNSFLIQRNVAKSIYELIISLPPPSVKSASETPASDFYTFNLFSSINDEKPEWCAQLYFDMTNPNSKKSTTPQPYMKLCDAYSIETDIYLLRPLYLNLKLNEKYKFELFVYEALEVILIHGKEITPLDPIDRAKSQWYIQYKVNSKNELIISAKLTNDGPYISIFGYRVVD